MAIERVQLPQFYLVDGPGKVYHLPLHTDIELAVTKKASSNITAYPPRCLLGLYIAKGEAAERATQLQSGGVKRRLSYGKQSGREG